MTRTAIPTFTTGQIITAAFMNTYLKDNEAEHWSVINTLNLQINSLNEENTAIVGQSAGQLIPSGGVETNLQWNVNVRVNPAAMHSTSTNNDRIYAVKAGIYLIQFNGGIFSATLSGISRFIIKNDDGVILSYSGGNNISPQGDFESLSAIVYLEANQYVYVVASQNSTEQINLSRLSDHYPSFAMHLLKG